MIFSISAVSAEDYAASSPVIGTYQPGAGEAGPSGGVSFSEAGTGTSSGNYVDYDGYGSTIEDQKIKTSLTTNTTHEYLDSNVTLHAIIETSDNSVINGENVAVKLNNKTIGKTKINNNEINYTFYLTPGTFSKTNYTVNYVYGGSSVYEGLRADSLLVVEGYKPEVKITSNKVSSGNSVNITVNITSNSTYSTNGNAGIKINNNTYKINNTAYVVKVRNGSATFTINTTSKMIGTNNITITYSGNSKIASARVDFTDALVVDNKSRVVATVHNTTTKLGDVATLTANFKTTKGINVVKQKVEVLLNNQLLGTTNIINGTATYKFKISPYKYSSGNYTITFKTNETNYLQAATGSATLTLTPYTPVIKVTTTNASYIGDTITIKVNITNGTDYLARSGKVGLKINDNTYKVNNTAYTPKPVNGTVVFTIKTSKSMTGYNDITVTYSGNNQLTSGKILLNNAFYTENNTELVKKVVVNTQNTVRMGLLKVDVTLNNNNNKINDGIVTVLLNNTQIGQASVKNNTASVYYQVPTTYNGTYTVDAYYMSTGNTYTTNKTSTSVVIGKPEIGLTLITPTNADAGNNITIKVSNITLKNTKINNGTIIYILNNTIIGNSSVKNATTNYTYTIPSNYKGKTNISAYYVDTTGTIKSAMTTNNITIRNSNTDKITGLFVSIGSTVTKANVTTWKNSGITDVYVQARASINSTTTLRTVISLCNNTGIRVHAWIVCFKTSDGINMNSTQQNMITTFIQQVVRIDGVDGICLDYIRYSGSTYGVNSSVVTDFVKKVNTIVKGYDKNIILSGTVFPEKGATKTYYGQDCTALSDYLDVIMVMAYRYDYNKNTSWISDVTNYTLTQSVNAKVVSILQTYNTVNGSYVRLNKTTLENDAQAAVDGGSNGYALFKYELISQYPCSADELKYVS
ncbi:hypothetical protein [Methanosphaera sp.]